MPRQRNSGFTIVELLVVLAILAVLAGVVYAASGGVREKARQSVCLSNLHQIGLAVQMYRQDYGGSDAPGWPSQLGLPPNHIVLTDSKSLHGTAYLAGGRNVLWCPNSPHPPGLLSSYGWIPWTPRTQTPGSPPFPREVAQRGGDTPLVWDSLHDVRPIDGPWISHFILLLRLDGHVQALHTDKVDSWQW